MPARFREAFTEGSILSPAPPRCLRVYTTQAYERTAAVILGQGAHTPGGQELRRAFFGRSYEGELDKAGRLLIPAALRQRLELGGSVSLLGCGEYIELWDTVACNSGLAEAAAAYADHLASLDAPAIREDKPESRGALTPTMAGKQADPHA